MIVQQRTWGLYSKGLWGSLKSNAENLRLILKDFHLPAGECLFFAGRNNYSFVGVIRRARYIPDLLSHPARALKPAAYESAVWALTG